MKYLYEAIKPTRLYIKQCPHCGLKYFGKHTGHDIEKYPGSGVYWNKHLNYHRVESTHLWSSDWYHDTSIKRFALKFSHMNKIVESKQWANLKPEDGLDGGWNHVHNEETQRKAREKADASIMQKYGVTNPFLIPHVLEANRNKVPWNKGRTGIDVCSEETRKKLSLAASNRTHADSTKDSIRNGVIDYYRNKGLPVNINGDQEIENVMKEILQKLKK